MTVPIARVAATRYGERRAAAALLLLRPRLPAGPRPPRPAARAAAGRHRADRVARARGDGRGAHAARARRSTPSGLRGYRVGLGDAGALPGAARHGRRDRRARAARCSHELRHARLRPASSARSARSGWTPRRPSCCCACPQTARRRRGARRGGPERSTACARCTRCSTPAIAERVIFDLGLLRDLGYYTGAVFEVYDPARRRAARRRRALRRAARAASAAPLPAVGFALDVERLHAALTGEEGGVNGLTIAVPRGALFARHARPARPPRRSTPPRCAPTTARLIFPEAGIVTMRPSDVPTYVEAGAADLGITGKDVLMEQDERDVYELLDLRFGECRMILATVDGPDPAARALRRLGVMRVATKYPRVAARWFERTGRQAEIVEVKGSVELAPLTGLVEADRRPDRDRQHPARERPRRARGDRDLHRAPDRQPGRPQAQGGGDRRRAGADPCGLSASSSTATRARSPRASARSRPPPPDVGARVAEIIERGARRGRRRRARARRAASTPGGAEPRPLRVGADELAARDDPGAGARGARARPEQRRDGRARPGPRRAPAGGAAAGP